MKSDKLPQVMLLKSALVWDENKLDSLTCRLEISSSLSIYIRD